MTMYSINFQLFDSSKLLNFKITINLILLKIDSHGKIYIYDRT